MIEIRINHNIKEVIKQIDDLKRRHIPIATAYALTQAAITAAKKTRTEMTKVFHMPTQYALNSLRWQKATPEKQASKVWVKSKFDTTKGTAPENFIAPEVLGGYRKQKGFEKALIGRGLMPHNSYAVVASGADLDVHGNIKVSQLRQILSYMGSAEGKAGSIQNMADRTKKKLHSGTKTKHGLRYINIKDSGGKLAPGIWKQITTGFGRSIKPVLLYVRRPAYRARLDIKGIVQRTINTDLEYEFKKGLEKAINAEGYKGFWRR